MEDNKVVKKQETDAKNQTTLASEVINMLGDQCARLEKIIRNVLIFCGLIIVCLAYVNYSHAKANERNNQRWIDYLSEYDFVSQDGEGYNYFNSGIDGDVVNGTE